MLLKTQVTLKSSNKNEGKTHQGGELMHLLKKFALLVLALAITLPLYSQEEVPNQPKLREDRITLAVRDRPFSDIIEGIREQTGRNIIYDEEIENIFVTIRLTDVSWRTVLEVISEKYNCLVEDVGGVGTGEVVKVSKPPTVTMEFEGADIRDIINQIAALANKNIVLSEQVQGTVSLRLKNVPWQDALESIIKTRGYVLVREKDGRILRVVPPEEIETQLETRIFKLRYIRPRSPYVAQMESEYFETIDQEITTTGGGLEVSPFSLLNALNSVVTAGRGRITYDNATNTIIVTDLKPQLDRMAEIIKELDKEPRQVFIDVKFVRTQNSDIFNFGVNFIGSGADEAARVSQSFGSVATRFPFTLGSGGFEDDIALASQADIDAGIPTDGNINELLDDTGGSLLQFGQLDFSNTQFVLRLLKRDTKSKIIQSPKIITLDNHEATIFVGQATAFPVTEIIQNDNGTTSVELQEADNSPAREGFQILVLPHIIPDTQKIQLTIVPSNDQLVGTQGGSPIAGFNRFTVGDATIDLPQTSQQVIVTHMILESGQTAVIGGLLSVNQTETVSKIPFLGDIPALGYLFKNKDVSQTKEDTFIFVTPRIVEPTENTASKIDFNVQTEINKQSQQYETIWQEDE